MFDPCIQVYEDTEPDSLTCKQETLPYCRSLANELESVKPRIDLIVSELVSISRSIGIRKKRRGDFFQSTCLKPSSKAIRA